MLLYELLRLKILKVTAKHIFLNITQNLAGKTYLLIVTSEIWLNYDCKTINTKN